MPGQENIHYQTYNSLQHLVLQYMRPKASHKREIFYLQKSITKLICKQILEIKLDTAGFRYPSLKLLEPFLKQSNFDQKAIF